VAETTSTRRTSGIGGKVGFAVYLIVTVVLLAELVLRGYFALQIGPRVLAYGTPWYRNAFGETRKEQLIKQYDRELVGWDKNEDTLNTVSKHNNEKGGYFKFFPNEKKYIKDIDSGEIFPVTINSHGFRGKEFSVAKPDDVIRVLTLGASSTFGFYNKDDETYPYLLEQRLNKLCHGPKRFEVINFAIPDARAEQIRSMFVAEGLALDPDVITFYEGRNDSARIRPMDFRQAHSSEASVGWLHGAWEAMTRTFVLARFVDEQVAARTQVAADQALESLRTASARASKGFIGDLEEIREVADRRHILFIVANQQANSKSWFGIPAAQRMSQKGVTYGDEVAGIEHILERGEPISGYEFNFLIHARLMRDLRAWADKYKLPFVDIIKLLDQERQHMVSWVHLDAYANHKVAGALADEILRRECPDRMTPPEQVEASHPGGSLPHTAQP
jgi:hypothetical protein